MVIAHGLSGFEVFLVFFAFPVTAYALGIASVIRCLIAKRQNLFDGCLAIAGLLVNGLVVTWGLSEAGWIICAIFSLPCLMSLGAFLRWRSLPE